MSTNDAVLPLPELNLNCRILIVTPRICENIVIRNMEIISRIDNLGFKSVSFKNIYEILEIFLDWIFIWAKFYAKHYKGVAWQTSLNGNSWVSLWIGVIMTCSGVPKNVMVDTQLKIEYIFTKVTVLMLISKLMNGRINPSFPRPTIVYFIELMTQVELRVKLCIYWWYVRDIRRHICGTSSVSLSFFPIS